jgi:predicted nucleic acid-binding protein
VIALRKGDRRVLSALRGRRNTTEEVGISRLSHYELLLGGTYLWESYHDARELAWLEEVLSWLAVYEVDADVVKAAAELQAKALRRGEPLADVDLLIALSAKSGSELLTLDDDQLKMAGALRSKGVNIVAS